MCVSCVFLRFSAGSVFTFGLLSNFSKNYKCLLNVKVEKSEERAMMALERSSSGQMGKKFLVAALVTALVLIGLVPCSLAASDPPSVEWSKTYDGLQADSIIQTSDGGYAIAGTYSSSSFSYLAALIKIDSSGSLLWQKTYGSDVFGGLNNVVSVVDTRDLGV